MRHDPGPLPCTALARKYQKAWFTDFQKRVMENGEPFVIASALTPHEIFHAMDIPVVSAPWYSSIINGTQQSPHHVAKMDELGYHDGLPRFDTLQDVGATNDVTARDRNSARPKPALIVDRMGSDYAQRVTDHWSEEFGCKSFLLDTPALTQLRPDWHKHAQHDWETLYETHRLDFQVEQLNALITVIEEETGKTFDPVRFRQEMDNVNRLGEIIAETSDIIAKARPCPVPLTDQLSNVMACTWHRGTEWAIDHAKTYREEVRRRAAADVGFCRNEKHRLLWLNNGLWFNTGFYRYFEDTHNASFVWSMYSNFLSDGYRKYFTDDPLRALAARHISMNEQLHLPGWMSDWIIEQARSYGASGAVMLVPTSDRMASMGTRLCKLALEKAGIPVLEIRASMADAQMWDDAAMRAKVGDFIDERIVARAS